MTAQDVKLLRAMLLKERAAAQAAHQEHINSANACGGAMQQCDALLARLEALKISAEEKPGDEPEVDHDGSQAPAGGPA